MPDKREQILSRLETILATVPGIVTSTRNRGELPDKKRPAVVLMDADETADDRAFGRQRPSHSPNIVALSPEIYILAGGLPEDQDLGKVLNTHRISVLNAILLDEQLAQIVGSNGEIRYEGCITDLASGRAMQGEMYIRVTFIYVLNPRELL